MIAFRVVLTLRKGEEGMTNGVTEEMLKGLLSAEVANVALFIMGIGLIMIIVLVVNVRQLGKWYLPIMTKRNEEFALIRHAIEASMKTDQLVLEEIKGLRNDFSELRVIILEKKETLYTRDELSEIVRNALNSNRVVTSGPERPRQPFIARLFSALAGFPTA